MTTRPQSFHWPEVICVAKEAGKCSQSTWAPMGNSNWVSRTASSALAQSLAQLLPPQLFNHFPRSLLPLQILPGSQAVRFTTSYASLVFQLLSYLSELQRRPWNCVFLTPVPPSFFLDFICSFSLAKLYGIAVLILMFYIFLPYKMAFSYGSIENYTLNLLLGEP